MTPGGGLPIQVVLGPCDDMRAEVFIRAASPELPRDSVRLVGEVAGPECRRSITLPVHAALADLGPGGAGLLAKAVLTEPAFWTPDLPNLYRLTAALVADGRAVAETTQRIGLRRSGVRGRSLWLEGRRWVPRGVAYESRSCDVKAVHAAGLAAVVADPPEHLLAEADEVGLVVIAVADPAGGQRLEAEDLVARIMAWAMHPSAVITILPVSLADATVATAAAAARRLKGTMLLLRAIEGTESPCDGIPAGIDGLCITCDAAAALHGSWRELAPPVPLVAWQRDVGTQATDRAACDRLQAALAAWGLSDGRVNQPWDWAGYIVS